MDADALVVGAGLAGLVAACELADAGRTVLLLDQESEANLGGQAWWSFGGLFLVDSPEQRRMGVRDSVELAWQDWQGSAGWDRLTLPDGSPGPDHWGREWARSYVEWAAGEKRAWLRERGVSFFPVVGWAERGDGTSSGHGNSVPRFHIPWGTGTGLVAPFEQRVRAHVAAGRVVYRPRHRVEALGTSGGAVTGVRGVVLADDDAPRGAPSSREVVGDFALEAPTVLVASGGIGGNHDLVRAHWPERLGGPPETMLTGVPAYVDGSMLAVAEEAGGTVVNRDRMWHYVEGVRNWDPVWPGHAIRILPGPSAMWFDARGERLPSPYLPGFDTLGTLAYLRQSGFDHSWFVLNQSLVSKEVALSGSEQNLDLTERRYREVVGRRGATVPPAVQAFLDHGEDWLSAPNVASLVAQMNALEPDTPLDPAHLERQLVERDRQVENAFAKDAQVAAIHVARRYRGDRLTKRAFPPHRILDPRHGPLVAVRLRVLSRKTLGGLHTDLSGRVLGVDGAPVPGLYAAGEAAGFGGGGVHGYRSLEGTFVGGCLFTGRQAGRAMAAALR
ncbi:FAD-binding dehydrogenase [Phycicoccus endophyticus]|uniref:FAD-binding dehydrogenase n=1 Tax=Phycicoccus endophyticus TaxID=1690220 RepID=A0A7G9R0D0_9MICO|nr:FAD-binding dehydrogenase [Phycicoccus endophyticus]NHI20132.1 FAD-binding dehydrogenase [Phycicoccus endophyticus]QNN49055.1 FAD-binding dehydrogenase [Phycicoccus endophyticus]